MCQVLRPGTGKAKAAATTSRNTPALCYVEKDTQGFVTEQKFLRRDPPRPQSGLGTHRAAFPSRRLGTGSARGGSQSESPAVTSWDPRRFIGQSSRGSGAGRDAGRWSRPLQLNAEQAGESPNFLPGFIFPEQRATPGIHPADRKDNAQKNKKKKKIDFLPTPEAGFTHSGENPCFLSRKRRVGLLWGFI